MSVEGNHEILIIKLLKEKKYYLFDEIEVEYF